MSGLMVDCSTDNRFSGAVGFLLTLVLWNTGVTTPSTSLSFRTINNCMPIMINRQETIIQFIKSNYISMPLNLPNCLLVQHAEQLDSAKFAFVASQLYNILAIFLYILSVLQTV